MADNYEKHEKQRRLLLGNPREIASVVRDQTLIVANELTRAHSAEDEMTHPLKIYSSYSRFTISIIGKDNKSVVANLKTTSVPGIVAATDYAYRKHMDKLYASSKKDMDQDADPSMNPEKTRKMQELFKSVAFTDHIPDPPFNGACPAAFILGAGTAQNMQTAYMQDLQYSRQLNVRHVESAAEAANLFERGCFTDTVKKAYYRIDPASPALTKRIASGHLKGKTPGEVILTAYDREDAINQLRNQYTWLKENRNPKYAVANKEQMAAITQAVQYYRDGRLTNYKAVVTTEQVIPLYTGGFRPILRKKLNDKNWVYELYIKWNIGSTYPVTIEIKNYYATVNRKEDGTLNVVVSSKEQEKRCRMSLSPEEWMNVVYMIQANMRTFENINAQSCYRSAYDLRKQAMQIANKEHAES